MKIVEEAVLSTCRVVIAGVLEVSISSWENVPEDSLDIPKIGLLFLSVYGLLSVLAIDYSIAGLSPSPCSLYGVMGIVSPISSAFFPDLRILFFLFICGESSLISFPSWFFSSAPSVSPSFLLDLLIFLFFLIEGESSFWSCCGEILVGKILTTFSDYPVLRSITYPAIEEPIQSAVLIAKI